ncbi:MAG: BH0638 unknown conserved protein, partial [uncultured Acidimicrobiales bacterium]
APSHPRRRTRRRPGPDRLLQRRRRGGRWTPAGRRHDHDPCAVCPTHRPALDGPGPSGPARAGGQDRERSGVATAVGARRRRRGLRGDRGGRDHPVPRRVPLHRRRPHRSGALPSTLRSRHHRPLRRPVRLFRRHSQLHRHPPEDAGDHRRGGRPSRRGPRQALHAPGRPHPAQQPLHLDLQAVPQGPGHRHQAAGALRRVPSGRAGVHRSRRHPCRQPHRHHRDHHRRVQLRRPVDDVPAQWIGGGGRGGGADQPHRAVHVVCGDRRDGSDQYDGGEGGHRRLGRRDHPVRWHGGAGPVVEAVGDGVHHLHRRQRHADQALRRPHVGRAGPQRRRRHHPV